jgi:glyoxylase-like metal-dependent hydrolase (beta-lactamase superfamily II)
VRPRSEGADFDGAESKGSAPRHGAPSRPSKGASPALARVAKRGIHCLAIPTPFAVGRVNCYLVEDDPFTLLDTGPNSATSLTALQDALAERGRCVEELERIVVTHQHIDHIGLTEILARRSGAEVCSLSALAPWLANYKREMEANDRFSSEVMLRNGIPQDVVHALRAVSAGFRAWGAAAHVTRSLDDGDLLEFAGRRWRVHHRPGHSPSDTVFHDEDSGELFGGDHLIQHISSNPLISLPLGAGAPGGGAADPEWPRERTEEGLEGQRERTERLALDGDAPVGQSPAERPRALVTYLDSLRRTRAMDLAVVLAGHGEPVEDHRGLIDKRFAMHERRASKLYRLICERPRNAYELAQEMWGDVAVTQAYLTLSEVLGHVDLLIEDGRVVERERDGVAYFEVA